jgi:NADH dehydrogenase
MHVLLTGATGFVGAYVLRELLASGHTARCLMRDRSAPLRLPATDGSGDWVDAPTSVERVRGDVTDPKSLQGVVRGCDAVIHLVGIIEEAPSKGVTFERIHTEGTRNVVEAAREAEIERFVQMSANGARAGGVSRYQTSKFAAEEIVAKAGFEHWGIFRPSVVFGDPGEDNPEFSKQLLTTLVKPFPVWPIFGDGQYPMQPVAVEVVAKEFAQALTTPEAHGQRFCVAGPDRLPYTDALDRIAYGAGLEPKPKIPQPIWLVRAALKGIGLLPLGDLKLLPISEDQFEMLIEGNACDPAALHDTFDLPHVRFAPENLGYLRRYA